MAIFCEKFGWGYSDYMHSINFMVIDMMLVDSPRMLSEEEQKQIKKTKVTVKDDKELEQQLKQMFK